MTTALFLVTWSRVALSTGPRCRTFLRPTALGWLSAGPMWYAPMTAFMCWRTTCGFPSGVSYMIANRKSSKASLPRLYRSSRVQEVEQYGALLRTTLSELAPGGKSDPVIALLSPGVYNSAYYEQHVPRSGDRCGTG